MIDLIHPVLHIERAQVKEMTEHAETFDGECCGFLFGNESDTRRTITKTLAAKNNAPADRHKRFEIAPLEYLAAENLATLENIELLGIYHSHPNHPAIPSPSDLASAQPHFSYLILSLMNGKVADIRSWRLTAAFEFKEEKIC